MTPPIRYCEVCGQPNPLRPGQRPWDYRMRKSCSEACTSVLKARGHGQVISTSEEFWALVRPEGDCLVWTGRIDRAGYGQLSYQHRRWAAARLAYTLAHGPVPPGLQVRHVCDNPPCCSPEHLLIGTMADNNRDRVVRGRTHLSGLSGEANSMARLTAGQVKEIRRLYAAGGTSHATLAKTFGISKRHVWTILNGKRWKNV